MSEMENRTVEIGTIVHPSGVVLRLYAEKAIDESLFNVLVVSIEQSVKHGLPVVFNHKCRVEIASPAPPVKHSLGCSDEPGDSPRDYDVAIGADGREVKIWKNASTNVAPPYESKVNFREFM